MNLDNYKKGFCHNDTDHPITEEEWLFSEEESNEDTIVYQAYDANMCPLPMMSKWNLTDDERQARIDKALKNTEGFKGAVYLDDVKIKNSEL